MREGDTLVVTRIDRLARSIKELQDVVHALKLKGAALNVMEQPIDYNLPLRLPSPDLQ
jgi:DNA invertase Pin-like site-specific DNA recombinase